MLPLVIAAPGTSTRVGTYPGTALEVPVTFTAFHRGTTHGRMDHSLVSMVPYLGRSRRKLPVQSGALDPSGRNSCASQKGILVIEQLTIARVLLSEMHGWRGSSGPVCLSST